MSDEYIKREDAVRRIAVLMMAEAESDGCEDQPMENYIEYALEDLADIPPADVAPVIWCKDCKWWDKSEGEYSICCHPHYNIISVDRGGLDYCSRAERKDNDIR